MLKLPVNRFGTWLLLAIMIIGGALAAAPAWGRFVLPEEVALLTAPLIGVFIFVPAFVGLCTLVRCRKCRYRVFWHAVARRNHQDGIGWFLTAAHCPECGEPGP